MGQVLRVREDEVDATDPGAEASASVGSADPVTTAEEVVVVEFESTEDVAEGSPPAKTPPPPGTDSTGSTEAEAGANFTGVDVADPLPRVEEAGYPASDSSEVGAALVALAVAVLLTTTDDPGVVVWPAWGIASGTAEYGKSPRTVLTLG